MGMSQACPECGAESAVAAKFCPECGAPFGDPSDLVGSTLAGKYEIQERIGEGSMGRIYLAMHLGLEKRVAIKVLHPGVQLGPEASARFRREGVAAGRIRHRNAIEVFDFDTTEAGLTFLAMEFVKGRDLRQVIDEDGALPFDDASAIVLQVLAALKAAHALDIVHRDLKPANIMLADEEGARTRVKVLDFGLSKLVSRHIEASVTTIPGRIIGTPLYMAPEQSSGEEADTRADLYAVGLIFFELLAGERPFRGRTLTELLYAQATEPVPDISGIVDDPDLPEHLDAFFERALHRDREARFQSADEMVSALLGEGMVLAPPDDRRRGRVASSGPEGGEGRGAPARASRAPLVAGFAAVAIVAVAAVLVLSSEAGDDGASATTGAAADAPRLRERPAAVRPVGAATYLQGLDKARFELAAGDARAALMAANAAFALPQRDPEAFLVRGLAHAASGDTDAAERDLETAIEQDPGFDEARVELGWLRLAAGDADGATECFEPIGARSSHRADAYAGLGTLALNEGLVITAEEKLAAAIAADPECWRAHAALGEAALAVDDPAKAVESYAEAKRWRPADPILLEGLGRAQLAARQDEPALASFEEALDLAPGSAAALTGAAAAALRLDRPERAIEAIAELGPSRELGGAARRLDLAARVGAEDWAGLREELDDIDRRESNRAALLELRAGIENLARDHEAALASADRAIRVDGERAGAHYQRAVACFGLERYEESNRALIDALNLEPEWAEPYLLLGVIHMDYVLPFEVPVEGLDEDPAREFLIRYTERGGKDPRAEDWIVELEESGR